MKRQSLLNRVAFLTGCIAALSATKIASAYTAEDLIAQGTVFVDQNQNGTFDSGEKGLAGVSVSNGKDVTATDASGRYRLPVDSDSIVFVVKPSGYRPPLDQDHLSRFYYIHKPAGSPEGLKFPGVPPTGALPKEINFPLTKSEEPSAFDVLFFGDPQPRDQKEIDYIAHDVVEGLIDADAAFGVTLGDILFDDLSLFASLNRTIGKIGVPWYNVLGNHDIDYASDTDELSDETFELVYGPPYYSFNYGGVHFIAIDDVHWMKDGDKKLYRTGLSDKQLDFIENDLKLVPQDKLVVVMMHIPFVRSTPWLEPKRERLFRILESRDHCISLAGHTHHHEHTMIGAADGWKGAKPHHHMINVTVCGSWWSGKPDEQGIPHAMCADGTPNGYTILHFDGGKYQLEYRAARRESSFQMRITAPEVVMTDKTATQAFHANVFNAFADAKVEWKFAEAKSSAWLKMDKVAETDPTFQALYDEEQKFTAENAPWRKLARPMVSPHLWKATLGAGLEPGTYTIQVRATNPDGQVLTGERIIRIE
ncbi:MAG: calcineurin-like phosphoesterase C-terminal domain-containing protein [Planctomyces sp.]|nr:calcineurin-like phosphoesterase C-terminal domain-containing protein [Planctomyces sp.]